MCGINGFNWSDYGLIDKMNKKIKYRGPNHSGKYVDDSVSLGHVRLSILDLSEKGNQPMEYEFNGKKAVITYNGEIYNFLELKQELIKKGYEFNSNTDTELILASYLEWGFDCIKKFNGMWSFCIYDVDKKIFFCSRDRLGIKPFYYSFRNGKFVFSSEMKSILLALNNSPVNYEAIYNLFNYRVILGNKTLINEIKKLLPGEFLIFDLRNRKITLKKYWDVGCNDLIYDKNTILNKLKTLFESSVRYRLISDVPIGVSLSGGLDSSLVTSIAYKYNNNLTAYTVGFGFEGDENKEAEETAHYLGINHKNIYVDIEKIKNNLDKIVFHLEEAAADPAIIPSYFIYKEIAKDVKVLLLGEGSDEIFGGYDEYKIFSLPIPNIFRKRIFEYLRKPFKEKLPLKNHIKYEPKINYDGNLNDYLLTDLKNILPNFQLLRVDKLSMAHSLEARVPFLDYRLVEFAFKIPPKYKINKFTGKYILREVAKHYLPDFVINRRKKTFFSPLDIIEDILLDEGREFAYDKVLNDIIDYNYFEKVINNYSNLKGRNKNRKRYELFIWWLIEKSLRNFRI
ncbi:asparagine synthase (glutamine-hydrolyzing) [Methanocaldococcus sp. 10A]